MSSHGDRSLYIRGCRCESCRRANTRYAKVRELRGSTLIDAAEVRAHVAMLRAAGVGKRTIAKRAQVALSLIDRLSGDGRHRPALRTRPQTAARILAVQPDHVAGATLVDITGTTRRLQALVAIGWTQTELATRIGWTVQNLCSIVHQRTDRVTKATADKVLRVFDELSMTTGPSKRSRALAERNGWAPPLAWDDDTIDDPGATAAGWKRSRRSPLIADDVMELVRLGETVDAIAARFGVNPSTVLGVIREHRRQASLAEAS